MESNDKIHEKRVKDDTSWDDLADLLVGEESKGGSQYESNGIDSAM